MTGIWKTGRGERIIAGMFSFAFGVYIAIASTYLPDFGTSPVSPGLVPFLTGVLIAMLGLIVLYKSVRRDIKTRPAEDSSKGGAEREIIFTTRVLLSIGLVFIYILVYRLTSFLVSTPPFLFGSMLLLTTKWGKRSLIWAAIISFVVTIIIKYIFRDVFQVFV
jgi:uncharacterized membrane protein YidH (DUF202 family)